MSSEPEVRQRKVRFSAWEDVIVLKEVLSVNPYELPSRWQDIADHVRTMSPKGFNTRNVKDRVDLLLNTFVKGEKEILKKSGTEEEYTEREVLLEEIKTLKDSTVRVPKRNRALTQAVRLEGEMLRDSAATSMTPAFVMQEEMLDNVIIEIEGEEAATIETPPSPPPPDLPPPSSAHPIPSPSPCGAADDRPVRLTTVPQLTFSTASTSSISSFNVDSATPAKRKSSITRQVIQEMEKKRELQLANETRKIEVEMLKAENERRRLDLEGSTQFFLQEMDRKLNILLENQEKIVQEMEMIRKKVG